MVFGHVVDIDFYVLIFRGLGCDLCVVGVNGDLWTGGTEMSDEVLALKEMRKRGDICCEDVLYLVIAADHDSERECQFEYFLDVLPVLVTSACFTRTRMNESADKHRGTYSGTKNPLAKIVN